MWILIVMTFGFVSTDKVVFQEFTSREKCEIAKQLILKRDAEWKRVHVTSQDIIGNKNFTPALECTPQ